jgi:tetratricopeptide (TPR) repeat protein
VGAGVVLMVGAVFVDRSRSAVWQDDRLLWEEVVRHWPENMPARINLGAAYMSREEYERAEGEYRIVQAHSPYYPRVYYNLGLLALRQGRSEEAKAAFQRVIALNPLNDGAYSHLGILAWRAGDNVAAEAAFRSALRINPTQREALNNLAALYLGRREWSQALDLVTAALQRDPGALEAAYNRGLALAGLGRRAEAETVLREVRERLPPDEKFDRYRTGIDDVLDHDAP